LTLGPFDSGHDNRDIPFASLPVGLGYQALTGPSRFPFSLENAGNPLIRYHLGQAIRAQEYHVVGAEIGFLQFHSHKRLNTF